MSTSTKPLHPAPQDETTEPQVAKRKRGRPRKNGPLLDQPKRKRGRPRRAEPDLADLQDIHLDLADRTRASGRRSGHSTRELIVAMANEVINRTGIVDFRIETVARALSLSPGNITYHFPKKEDIIAAIWEQYETTMRATLAEIITPFLDIKQLYLYFRVIASKAIAYVGVTAYYFGDLGVLRREHATFARWMDSNRTWMYACYDRLTENGCLRPIADPLLRDLIFASQITLLRWWINNAFANHGGDRLEEAVNRYVSLSLLQLLPYLTDEGRRQFKNIANQIK
ncbi:TetR/AcrR family transcriptional regulator [uncultured Rikenella sp.]|uniref:TetR/AcrR family transcriptional regulator n=1 Tax=uncultured Rikenella sp. TaxID=368003 RepID=UPI0025E8E075|nr:TetR/AcrR family transcriptional regulator [uncultured Rikenella sp.]